MAGPLVLLADLRAGDRLVRGQALPLEAHVALVEEPEHRALLDGVETRGVRHDGVAERLGLVDDRLAGVRAAVDHLVEAPLAAAEDDVGFVVDLLLGDRAGPARRLLVLRARGHVGRALAAARVDVRREHRGRGVGDLGGRDVAGRPALLRDLLEDRGQRHVGAWPSSRCGRWRSCARSPRPCPTQRSRSRTRACSDRPPAARRS